MTTWHVRISGRFVTKSNRREPPPDRIIDERDREPAAARTDAEHGLTPREREDRQWGYDQGDGIVSFQRRESLTRRVVSSAPREDGGYSAVAYRFYHTPKKSSRPLGDDATVTHTRITPRGRRKEERARLARFRHAGWRRLRRGAAADQDPKCLEELTRDRVADDRDDAPAARLAGSGDGDGQSRKKRRCPDATRRARSHPPRFRSPHEENTQPFQCSVSHSRRSSCVHRFARRRVFFFAVSRRGDLLAHAPQAPHAPPRAMCVYVYIYMYIYIYIYICM